ncbi:MAG: hypothetical protein ACRD2W_00655 [Acidimicrobiales bacterium]
MADRPRQLLLDLPGSEWEHDLLSRVDGDVLLFSPDHAFDHVEVLGGCPPYSLYRLQGAPSFVAWVGRVAAQWLLALDLA